MLNFEYYNPTRIVFGRGTIARLAGLVPADAKVLLTYGGGSLKRNGVYDQILDALAGRQVTEFGGIEPNPAYETCMDIVAQARREKVDFLLAAGGGSVVDATKFVAAATPYRNGDPWVFLEKRGEVLPTEALPLGVVLTLPATGSEMNPFAVVSRRRSQEKRAFESELIQPRFSILDPETTYSLPRRYVRNGLVDAFVHVVEQYLTYPADAPLQDRQAEAVLTTLVEVAPEALNEPPTYEARADLMWCATHALNRLLGCGVPQDFATHLIGHELTAFYGLDHAETLAVVLPSRWRFDLPRKAEKLRQYARRVWGLTNGGDDLPESAIARTEAFFDSVDMPTHLRDYDIDPDEAARKIEQRLTARNALLGEHRDLTPVDAAEIIRRAA